jgi:hypothetical protein
MIEIACTEDLFVPDSTKISKQEHCLYLEQQMDKSTISGWIRQARHRAKRHDIYSELNIEDIDAIVQYYANCAYCEVDAETLDHAFPLKDSAPNVAANVLPSCRGCKQSKRNNDLVWMFNKDKLSKEKYLSLLEEMLQRPGGEYLREHIKAITGM